DVRLAVDTSARPPRPTLLPYTTLFRSYLLLGDQGQERPLEADQGPDEGVDEDEQRELREVGPQPEARLGHGVAHAAPAGVESAADRKSTRLNSSHVKISYAVFCLKKKK